MGSQTQQLKDEEKTAHDYDCDAQTSVFEEKPEESVAQTGVGPVGDHVPEGEGEDVSPLSVDDGSEKVVEFFARTLVEKFEEFGSVGVADRELDWSGRDEDLVGLEIVAFDGLQFSLDCSYPTTEESLELAGICSESEVVASAVVLVELIICDLHEHWFLSFSYFLDKRDSEQSEEDVSPSRFFQQFCHVPIVDHFLEEGRIKRVD